MTRILFVTESFHPVLGGGERHIRSLASSLAASGTPTHLVTRRTDGSWPAQETLDGIDVVRVGPSGRESRRKFQMVPAVLRAVARLRTSFDVVVVRGTRVLGAPVVAAARWLRKPVVLQPEVNGELSGEVFTWGKPWGNGVAGLVVREAASWRRGCLNDADAFVAMSRRIADECRECFVRESRIHLVPHGVDRNRFHPLRPDARTERRASLGLEGRTWIAYTGRLLRGKGLERLVDAFATIHRDIPRTGLLLVGSGDDQPLSIEAELKERVRHLGLPDAVRFTGRVDDVETYLQAADIFAFPSEYEALGLSLIEAAACGLPCVGARTGGIVDVIEDGASGILVPPGDTEALTGALSRLVNEAPLRAAYGQRGVTRVRDAFDAQRTLVRYRALFDEVARQHRDRSARAVGGSAA